MDAGDGDVAFGRIGADDIRAQTRHGFGQKTAAAADVEKPQAREGRSALRSRPELRRDLRL
jgi:hypothetical protein